jgi:predicted phage-related endonuclease
MANQPLLNDPDIRYQYLELIAQGKGRFSAAKVLGISNDTVRRRLEKDTEFRSAVEAAEEQSYEPVNETMRTKALDGSVAAARLVRDTSVRRLREHSVKVDHAHKLELGEGLTDNLDKITRLIDVLRERKERQEVPLTRQREISDTTNDTASLPPTAAKEPQQGKDETDVVSSILDIEIL